MFTVMLLCIINTSAEGASTRCSIVQNLDIIGGIKKKKKRGGSQTWNQIHFFLFSKLFFVPGSLIFSKCCNISLCIMCKSLSICTDK